MSPITMITTTNDEKQAIEQHVKSIRARRVLEIGAFHGETSAVLRRALHFAPPRGTLPLPGRHLVVIDPMRWSSELLRNGILRHLPAGVSEFAQKLDQRFEFASYEDAFWRTVGGPGDDIRLFRALSTDPELLANPDPRLGAFDLVFIDGDHSFEGALADLENWGTRVRPGGIVLVHDATARFPGVVRAIETFAAKRPVEVAWPARDSLCAITMPSVELHDGASASESAFAPRLQA